VGQQIIVSKIGHERGFYNFNKVFNKKLSFCFSQKISIFRMVSEFIVINKAKKGYFLKEKKRCPSYPSPPPKKALFGYGSIF
jgi:hypothetical protein